MNWLDIWDLMPHPLPTDGGAILDSKRSLAAYSTGRDADRRAGVVGTLVDDQIDEDMTP